MTDTQFVNNNVKKWKWNLENAFSTAYTKHTEWLEQVGFKIIKGILS